MPDKSKAPSTAGKTVTTKPASGPKPVPAKGQPASTGTASKKPGQQPKR